MSHERRQGDEPPSVPGEGTTPAERVRPHGDGGGRRASEEARLAELRGHEERLEALRARRTDCEVERIVAKAALRTARTDSGPEVSGPDAATIADALARLRRLESQYSAHRAFAEAGVRSGDEMIERLRAGDDVLGAWLAADRDDAGPARGRIAKQALLVACLAILALAFMVHPAFLVLLVPVGGAMSFLLWTGQDRAWRRVGARRRFERLGLDAPAAWTEDAVRERRRSLARIAEQVRERGSTLGSEGIDADGERLRAGVDAARSDLHDALAAAGLGADRLDGPTEAALRAVARVYRAEAGLQEVAEEVAGEREGAGAIRESLYRRLARDGVATTDGDASAGTLEAGLQRVRRR